ncbi:hypothetical protein [Amycolatopsis sp. FDAARGOS 1241]|uniref:hypothetical protein n=1 Tax=Amycolatopsis sp. FDAARGOS 1241 TaxID=2778070 RepID=UPI00194E280C|nr:hypothetical protein [Amycolatopsis sp. FDAARGOS 1241]QRP47868.1 hypothetical protein I6J71_08130 [Amycolatopsis sp. FDAARGOS 1241]
MTDVFLVILTLALAAAFGAIVLTRTVLAERAAGARGRPYERTRLVRRLDRAGALVTVLVIAAVVFRVVNTVL